MFSRKNPSQSRSVTFRLTAWNLLVFSLVSAAVLWLAQERLGMVLRERTDADLREDLRELQEHFQEGGIRALREDIEKESAAAGPETIFLALVSGQGGVEVSSDLSSWRDLALPPAMAAGLSPGGIALETFHHGHDGERSNVRIGCLAMSGNSLLVLGHTLVEEEELTAIFRRVLVLALLGMLTAGGILGCLLTRSAMAGVQRVTRVALSMGRDRLGERVDVGSEGREITALAVAFNGMLERIDALVRSLREVTDNLAHDLRSPLTRLRGMAETTLTSDAGIEELRDLAGTVVEESDALVALVNTVLEIAEAEAGRLHLETTSVSVAALLSGVHDLFQPAAEDRGIRLLYLPVEQELLVHSDLSRLQRVMANLLDNAIKYTPARGSITLSAEASEAHVTIRVADSGIGICAEDLARIFSRFYRADISRSQPGTGLGLSLSQALIQALGGQIRVRSEPGKGSTFSVVLPAIVRPAV